ncbi:hypothetical protein [Pedobacter sandarakinus]|uniref:hypothetical protein n=1 Tax=Pedobacter sandarakinus TaxID=353156 RepID=UPI002245E1BC|nr:hypothetical protein [Pedobacter sandarakinus]MCX2574700.1 hypothetical protein [Pedobacter sandarakinus]
MGLFLIYWILVAVLFAVGLLKVIIGSIYNKPAKPGLKLMLIALILIVIGGGVCAYILTNLNLSH